MAIFKLERQGRSVGFIWVQTDVIVGGNEVADGVTVASLGRDMVDVLVPFGRMECCAVILELLRQL